MANRVYLFRADGSHSIGTGHIFRTLVLAKHLSLAENDIIYACRKLNGFPEKRIVDEGFRIEYIPETISMEDESHLMLEIIAREDPEWIIVDHYRVTEPYYNVLIEAHRKIMVIDDMSLTSFPVDIILNQNMNAEKIRYKCNNNTKKLLGPEYALIAESYRNKRCDSKIRAKLNKVMVFMGGGDEFNQTLKVLKGLDDSEKDFHTEIVLGYAYKFRDTIEDFIKNANKHYTVHHDIKDLAQLMADSDLAVGTGGIACWEMCTMKLPMILMPIADNQVNNASGLEESKAAINAGWYQDVEPESITGIINSLNEDEIERMSINSSKICDGCGVNKIEEVLKSGHE